MADLIEREKVVEILRIIGHGRPISGKRAISLIREMPGASMWIPCETELPCGGKRVLVTTAEGNVVDAIFVLNGNQWFRNGEYFTTDRVIAWMPLPSAYEQEKE